MKKNEIKINKEIIKLKECVKEKDERLKKQSRRIEKIESRYSTIVWSFIIAFVVAGFILLGYTMYHIDSNLPAATTFTNSIANDTLSGKVLNFIDPLQFFGYYIICFLAFVGFITVLYIVHWLIKDHIEAKERRRKRGYLY